MKDCRKRQVEKRDGETIHRCVHKQADQYRTPVDASSCDSCPLRVFIDRKNKPRALNSLPVIELPGALYPSCDLRYGVAKKTCGMTGLPVTPDHCNRCAKDTKDSTPNLMGKVMNYAAAVRKWVGAGKPERTDEEIKAIYDDHCSKCSMFDKARQVCNSCGCPANKDQPALKNKLRMATEQCPLGRFPAKVEPHA